VPVEMFLFMTYSRTESTFLLHRLLSLFFSFPTSLLESPFFNKVVGSTRDEPYLGLCVGMGDGISINHGHVRTAEIASRTRLLISENPPMEFTHTHTQSKADEGPR
jgi:hypothetical protein